MWCLIFCRHHVTSIVVFHSCLGTGIRVGTSNIFVIIVHLWTSGIRDICLFASVCWWEQYHETAASGKDSFDFGNRDNLVSWCSFW